MKFGERKINNDWDYIKCGLDITALLVMVLGGFMTLCAASGESSRQEEKMWEEMKEDGYEIK